MPHVLIVGGTGMLRGVSLALAQRGHATSVIAQSHARLAALVQEAAAKGGKIHPLPLDYGHDNELALAIRAAKSANGPISLAIAWIHDDAPRALPTIAGQLQGQRPNARLFEILGSESADPSLLGVAKSVEKDFPDILWRRVVLGFTQRGGASQGLAHEKICNGVLDAVDHDWTESVVGVVRPWLKQP